MSAPQPEIGLEDLMLPALLKSSSKCEEEEEEGETHVRRSLVNRSTCTFPIRVKACLKIVMIWRSTPFQNMMYEDVRYRSRNVGDDFEFFFGMIALKFWK